jgi:hypothetical protein
VNEKPTVNNPDAIPQTDDLRGAKLRVPQHVVYRAFPNETVVLNLQTGKYHGLNPTAGRMLEALAKTGSVAEAAAAVAEDYERPLADTEADVCRLCEALLARGLVEIEAGGEPG